MGVLGGLSVLVFVSISDRRIRVHLIKKEHLSKDMKEVRERRSNSWCKGPKVGPSIACLKKGKKANVLKPSELRGD